MSQYLKLVAFCFSTATLAFMPGSLFAQTGQGLDHTQAHWPLRIRYLMRLIISLQRRQCLCMAESFAHALRTASPTYWTSINTPRVHCIQVETNRALPAYPSPRERNPKLCLDKKPPGVIISAPCSCQTAREPPQFLNDRDKR